MTHYLIEFRFFGKVKREMRTLIYDVDRRFRLFNTRTHRPIPHITLAGPFGTTQEGRLIQDFTRICREAGLMRFHIKGYGTFDASKVVFIDIRPTAELDAFRWRLSQVLQPYCRLSSYDYERKFEYHSTIAMKIPSHKYQEIKKYLGQLTPFDHKYVLTRITLLKNSRILREYDFLQQRMLNREQAISKVYGARTKSLLDELFEGKLQPKKATAEWIEIPGTTPTDIHVPKKGLFGRIKDSFASPRTFIVSDLHLDHANIIKFCKRPFRDLHQMNKVLVDNWNNTVRPKDTVYFLGDLAYGRSSRNADYWLKRLNGKIIFIRGNHEGINDAQMSDSIFIDHDGEKILLIHDEKSAPEDWKGWTIHGHHHNNNPELYPLVNDEAKRMNVSVEHTNYRPIELSALLKKRK